MRFLRPNFSIAALLGVTALVAITITVVTYPSRQRAKTIATYDAQKQVVDQAIQEFVDVIKNEGFAIINDSTGTGGSGEWRQYAAITATGTDGTRDVCYVEVMGCVTHNENDQPTWMRILPMRISHRDRKLNARFIKTLVAKLDRRGWEYSIDSRCKGGGWFSTFTSDHYLATE
jgi:hypothetical protein